MHRPQGADVRCIGAEQDAETWLADPDCSKGLMLKACKELALNPRERCALQRPELCLWALGEPPALVNGHGPAGRLLRETGRGVRVAVDAIGAAERGTVDL